MLEEELILFSFVKKGVRTGEAGGGGLQPHPSNFRQAPIFGGQQEKIWAKPVFHVFFNFNLRSA